MKVGRIERALRERDVPRRLHKPRELPIGNLVRIHPEAIHAYLVNWSLFRIEVLRTHAEGSAGYPNHTGMF